MTLPAQSLPDAEITPPRRELSSPAAFIAVVAVSALVVILCVLGATMSGLFNFVTSGEPGTKAAPSANSAPSARVPAGIFPDGQWLVGGDIQPGTYSATVPAGSPGCTWERNASTDGTASSVLETGTAKEGEALVVGIKDTDKIFQSRGCGIWRRTAD